MGIDAGSGAQIRDTEAQGRKFEDDASTPAIKCAWGAGAAASAADERQQGALMQHRQTHEEQECRVVFLGPVRAGQGELGLEFSESRPTFWRVTFPPEDRPIIAVSHFFDWYQ